MPNRIVDRFNVDGQDYAIEPVIDPTPVEGSQHAVMSGGVYNEIKRIDEDKSATPISDSTKNFTAGGAYDLQQVTAPKNHSSATSEFGEASRSQFGHVKLDSASIRVVYANNSSDGKSFDISGGCNILQFANNSSSAVSVELFPGVVLPGNPKKFVSYTAITVGHTTGTYAGRVGSGVLPNGSQISATISVPANSTLLVFSMLIGRGSSISDIGNLVFRDFVGVDVST